MGQEKYLEQYGREDYKFRDHFLDSLCGLWVGDGGKEGGAACAVSDEGDFLDSGGPGYKL